MADSTNRRWALDTRWGRFVRPEAESQFRAHTAKETAEILRAALWVWVIATLIFIAYDFLTRAVDQNTLMLLAVRLVLIASLLGLILVTRRQPEIATKGAAVTLLEIVGFTTLFPLYFIYPDPASNTLVLVVTMLLLAVVYIVVPNTVINATVAAVYGIVATLVCAVFRDAAPGFMVTITLLLALPAVTGYLGARSIHVTLRRQFALLQESEQTNRRLQQEIEQRRLLEKELQLLAITDPLTGLFNRRHFENLFQHELDRAIRKKQSLCLCLVDLDFFKRINDGLGHDAGDQVLKFTAAFFEDSLRKMDVVGRLGGEEFVLLLPETPIESAMRLIEKLRSGLASSEIPVYGASVSVTATFAVVQVEPRKQEMKEVMRIADAALYRGKDTGRNCVVMASGLQQA